MRGGGWSIALVLGAVAAAAIIGGVVGGVIVRETWSPRSGTAAAATGDAAAVCPAARVADQALPSVVTVRAGSGGAGGTGSGVVIRAGGYVLTNNHVIAPAVRGGAVAVLRSDGETTDATIVGRDPLTDLAVIRAKDTSHLPAISVGDSGSLQVGEPVVALGSPLGLTSTVTTGIVSALDRYVRVPTENGSAAHLVGAVQTDASINPGNSGGALVDCHAHLIGINTAGATIPNSGGGGGSIGLGFAIPVDLAEGIAGDLISEGRVSRPSFGMQLQAISPQLAQATGGPPGLFVQAVTAGGPAEAAGLRPGDVIVEVDGEPVTSADALVVKTIKMKPGDVVHLKYERQGVSHEADLRLAAG